MEFTSIVYGIAIIFGLAAIAYRVLCPSNEEPAAKGRHVTNGGEGWGWGDGGGGGDGDGA
jgi:hypothetical protein